MSSSSAGSAPAAATACASSGGVRRSARRRSTPARRSSATAECGRSSSRSFRRLPGRRSPPVHAGDLEREQVGDAALLEHVEERPRAPVQARERVLRHDGRAHEHAHERRAASTSGCGSRQGPLSPRTARLSSGCRPRLLQALVHRVAILVRRASLDPATFFCVPTSGPNAVSSTFIGRVLLFLLRLVRTAASRGQHATAPLPSSTTSRIISTSRRQSGESSA